jgi:hypothetical protein
MKINIDKKYKLSALAKDKKREDWNGSCFSSVYYSSGAKCDGFFPCPHVYATNEACIAAVQVSTSDGSMDTGVIDPDTFSIEQKNGAVDFEKSKLKMLPADAAVGGENKAFFRAQKAENKVVVAIDISQLVKLVAAMGYNGKDKTVILTIEPPEANYLKRNYVTSPIVVEPWDDGNKSIGVLMPCLVPQPK